MTDIHAVIAELKALEAKQPSASKAAKMDATLPQLLAYIERLEAVARSLDVIWRTHSGYECARDALDALERNE